MSEEVSVSYARPPPEQRVARRAASCMSREIPITAESVVSWNESPVATEVDREVVLMNVGRGRFYGLGETGSSVWRRLGSPIRVDDLCRELMLEYQADPEILVKDVITLLEHLQEEGLVKVIAA